MPLPHILDIRIYYEDTDCGGVVYYANYLKYFERARTHCLEVCGVSVSAQLQAGIQFVVVRAELDCRSPARYGDVLTIETTMPEVTRAALTFAHVIREKQSGRLVVEGRAKLAATDLSGKVKRLPQELVARLQRE